MRLRIATWNLNTWINRRDQRSTDDCWRWADENLKAHLLILTEAPVKPPTYSGDRWSFAVRPGGFPKRGNWGTLIAGDKMEIRHLTSIGIDREIELDTRFPGSLTAADTYVSGRHFATVVGLYLPYRKDGNRDFVGHPAADLRELGPDLAAIGRRMDSPMVVAGDLNTEYPTVPGTLRGITRRRHRLVDPFVRHHLTTFRQDWHPHREFRMDYVYVSKSLAKRITAVSGGFQDHPDAVDWSDHAPLVVEIDW